MLENSTVPAPSPTGLTSREAAERLKHYDPNALVEKKVSPLLKFLGYFWGPIPWMIEIAAILSPLAQRWDDFWIIMALLVFNAGVGFWQEFSAGNAVEALSVIIRAIEEARRIIERMNSYAIYRISETIRIMFFVVLAMMFFNFYPITAIMIILLAFFNDVPIMTIAYDHTGLEQRPVRWNMHQVITVATAMGIVGIIGSFGMLLLAMDCPLCHRCGQGPGLSPP